MSGPRSPRTCRCVSACHTTPLRGLGAKFSSLINGRGLVASLGDGRPSAPPGAPGRPRAGRGAVGAMEGKRGRLSTSGPPRVSSPPRTPWANPSRPARRTSCRRTCSHGVYDLCARQSLKWNEELTPRPRVEAVAREGEQEWLLAHVWSSWSLVSQVKLSWTRSLCTASSWSTPSKGAALAMLGTTGDAARTILGGGQPGDPLSVFGSFAHYHPRPGRGGEPRSQP